MSIFLIFVLAGCAGKSQSEDTTEKTVSSEVLESLREQNPYDTYGVSERLGIQDFSKITQLDSVVALVVLQVTSEYQTATLELSPFEEQEAGYGGATEVLYASASVEQVLWNRGSFPEDTEISLYFGGAQAYDGIYAIENGGRYLCILREVPEDATYADIAENLYVVGKSTTYDIVSYEGRDVVLSIVDDPGVDCYSGWYLDAFGEEFSTRMEEKN